MKQRFHNKENSVYSFQLKPLIYLYTWTIHSLHNIYSLIYCLYYLQNIKMNTTADIDLFMKMPCEHQAGSTQIPSNWTVNTSLSRLKK